MGTRRRRRRFRLQHERVTPAREGGKANMETFKLELAKEIKRAIARLSSEGTVGVSADCLWQCVACNVSRLASAPQGTNGAYYARQAFNEVVATTPYARFVY